YNYYDYRRLKGGITAYYRVKFMSWWLGDPKDHMIGSFIRIYLGESDAASTYFQVHYWRDDSILDVWQTGTNTTTESDNFYKTNTQFSNFYNNGSQMFSYKTRLDVTSNPYPEIYQDYAAIKMTMYKSAAINQDLTKYLEVPDGWTVDSATLHATNLRLPAGVYINNTLSGATIYSGNYTKEPSISLNVTSAINNGYLNLELTSGSDRYADWGNSGSVDDENVIIPERNACFTDDIYVEVVIKKTDEGAVTYSAIDGAPSMYIEQQKVYNPSSGQFKGEKWYDESIHEFRYDFYLENSGNYLDYTVQQLTCQGPGPSSYSVSNLVIGDIFEPTFYIQVDNGSGSLGEWLTEKLGNDEYVNVSIEWLERFTMISSIDAMINLNPGSHGESSHDLVDRTQYYPGDEVCLVVHIDDQILDYANDSIENLKIEYKLVGVTTMSGTFSADNGDWYDPNTDDIYIYRSLQGFSPGDVTAQVLISVNDSGYVRHVGYKTVANLFQVIEKTSNTWSNTGSNSWVIGATIGISGGVGAAILVSLIIIRKKRRENKEFFESLDDQFAEWENKEDLKEGKI
ncbi:MAG: hypothetical protein ACTSWN_08305, partial [Promethearchaeota archaeon]